MHNFEYSEKFHPLTGVQPTTWTPIISFVSQRCIEEINGSYEAVQFELTGMNISHFDGL